MDMPSIKNVVKSCPSADAPSGVERCGLQQAASLARLC
jgi:hypothetical protein